MQRNTVLLSLFLLATLVLAAMPVDGVRSNLLDEAQNDAAEAATTDGTVTGPFGDWERAIEQVRFFMHTDDVADAAAGYYDYEPPSTVDPKTVTIDSLPAGDGLKSYTFDLDPGLRHTTAIDVHKIDVGIYARCSEGTLAAETGNPVRITIDILDLDPATGAWTPRDTGSATGHQPFRQSGMTGTPSFLTGATSLQTYSTTIGSPGADNGQSLAGDTTRLRLTFDMAFDGGICDLQFDGDGDSDTAHKRGFIDIMADSGRLNAWVEDRHGRFVQSLPAASSVSPGQRLFAVKVLQASAWGGIGAFGNDDAPVDHLGAMYTSQYNLRMRDVETGDVVYDDRQGADNAFLDRYDRNVLLTEHDSLNEWTYSYQYNTQWLDGTYRFEVFGLATNVHAPTVSIGLKGFSIDVLGGTAHEINPEESTLFNIVITNTGTDRDQWTSTITGTTSGWSADFLSRSTPLTDGGEATEQILFVFPPNGAEVGDVGTIDVRTRSSFPNEVDPVETTVEVTLVDGGSSGATLSGAPSVQEIFPGETIEIPGLRIRNEAPFTDNYVFRTVFPDDVVGWSARVDPIGTSVLPDSYSDFVVSVTAPGSAADGTSVSLTVQAVPIGSVGSGASLVIPLEVAFQPDVVLSALPALPLDGSTATQQIRDRTTATQSCSGLLGCTPAPHPDSANEDTALFRVEITNPTPVEETYEVSGAWRTSGSVQGVPITDTTESSNDCSDSADRGTGNPDYWRVDYQDGIDGAPGQDVNSGRSYASLTIPPFTTAYEYLELGWVPRGDTTDCPQISQAGAFTLSYRSTSDRSVVQTIELGAHRIAGGAAVAPPHEFGNSHHHVYIEPDRVDGEQRYAATSAGAARDDDGHYATASYPLRVSNLGNEHQEITVTVNAPKSGWGQRLVLDGSVPDNVACTVVNDQRVRCPSMGAGNEARLALEVTPNDGMPLHREVTHTVTVSTQLQGTDEGDQVISDVVQLTTNTIGQFDFDAQILKGARNAEPGDTVALPFVVQNTGSEGDEFETILLDGSWKSRFSGDTRFFLPGQSEQTGFVLVTVPAETAVGVERVFRVQVENDHGTGVKVLDFKVTVVAETNLDVTGVNSDGDAVGSVLLAERGAPNTVTVRAVSDAASDGVGVTFKVDTDALPSGWSVAAADVEQTAALSAVGSGSQAEVDIRVTAPIDALSTNQVPLLVVAETDESAPRVASGDIVLSLKEEIGVAVDVLSDSPLPVLAGGDVTHRVRVQNLGLGQDTITLSRTDIPSDWHVFFGTSQDSQGEQVPLGPLENRTVEVVVLAPDEAPAKQELSFNVFATSGVDTTVFDQATLTTVVGFNDMAAAAVAPDLYLAPEETGSFLVAVKNTGTLPDLVDVNVTLVTTSLADVGTFDFSGELMELRLNQTRQVPVKYTLGSDVPEEVEIRMNVTLTSMLNTQAEPVVVTVPISAHVLPYKARDVDGDRIDEYAVDRDRDPDNGYDEYRESRQAGGRSTASAPLASLLTAEAHASFNVTVTDDEGNTSTEFRYVIDGDDDGKRDHFLERSGDGIPDIYWDPDGNHSHAISVRKDVDGDAVPDLFVDVDGDDRLDRVFDVRTGRFIPLLVVDLDGDGQDDYVVDRNGNGVLDSDETVLYLEGGVLVTVLKIDVDGDGELDSVFDLDGDNRYDQFIRAGETTARGIVLKDVNGDGVLDWTYDSNGDGKMDHYYDPVTKQGGIPIDATASFVNALARYWFVPALFALVLVLFVVLIAVTRR